ncbi:hypothetical protein CPAR01_15854 [Colletotrichum paranaense]|uniref:Uncharacterized protein n=1 Tax=Colletotrichum paranaense TaxID=1914294 RepID=A0ABQ9RZ96_9PEZI|nr:hypothetical protein CPAR01_15854 [Colletotrichum paranaense]
MRDLLETAKLRSPAFAATCPSQWT